MSSEEKVVHELRFDQKMVEQRERMRTSPEQLRARVEASPYGPESKRILRQMVDNESTGQVGFALFDCPPVIVRGENATVFDADGKSYIDMLAGFAVSNVGQANPEVAAAIAEQAKTLVQYFDFPNEPRERLAERLAALAPGENRRVAFATSGAESVDLAIKLARWYTGAPQILSAYGGYHGTTQGTMAATTKGGMWSYFYPVGPHEAGHAKIPFSYPYRCPVGASPENCAEACLEFIRRMFRGKETPFGDGRGISNVAAILLEPMQASAGYVIPGEGYLSGIRDLCDEHGMLLIMDEIQAGMGRTGRWWGSDHENVVPDIITVSKSLASGVPISAVVAASELLESWGPGAHVSTFAATPLACAAAHATLDIYERDDIVNRSATMGAYFKECLDELADKHPIIGWIDAKGLFVGIELVLDRETKEPAADATNWVLEYCVREGLLFERGGYFYNRLQLIPPLTIEKDEIDRAVQILSGAFAHAEDRLGISRPVSSSV